MDGEPAPHAIREVPPARYVAPRTGLLQARVLAVFLALAGGGLASWLALTVTPMSPFGHRDWRMPVYGAWLAAAAVLVAVPAIRRGRWGLVPCFVVGMVPFGGLVWMFDGWRW